MRPSDYLVFDDLGDNELWKELPITASLLVDQGVNELYKEPLIARCFRSIVESALIRALDHSLVVGRSESQCCLLELLIVRCLWSIRESIGSDKNSWSQHVCWWMREWIYSRKSSLSQEVFAQSGSQWALIRAPDHNLVAGRSGNQCALKRAPDRKKFLINQGVNELW